MQAALCAGCATQAGRLALGPKEPTVLRVGQGSQQRLDRDRRLAALFKCDLKHDALDPNGLPSVPCRLERGKDQSRPGLAVVVADDANERVLRGEENQHSDEEPADGSGGHGPNARNERRTRMSGRYPH